MVLDATEAHKRLGRGIGDNEVTRRGRIQSQNLIFLAFAMSLVFEEDVSTLDITALHLASLRVQPFEFLLGVSQHLDRRPIHL